MNILGRALRDIDDAFLQSLCEGRVPESITHDYKSKLPDPRDHKARERLLKSVTAFANTRGGVLVFGFDGEDWSLPGLAEFDEDADPASLQTFIRSGTQPSVVETRSIILRRRALTPLFLLGVPRSLAGPHRLSMAFGGTFWRRSDRGNYPMSMDELRVAFNEAESWQSEAETFVERRIGGSLDDPRPTDVVLHVLPLGRLREQPFDIALARSFLSEADEAPPEIDRPNLDGWLRASEWSGMQLFRNGGLECTWPVCKLQSDPSGANIDGRLLETEIVAKVLAALSWFSRIGVSAPHVGCIAVRQARGKRMAIGFNTRDTKGFDRDLIRTPLVVLDDTRDAAQATKPLLDILWQSAGWPASPFFRDGKWVLDGERR